MIDYSPELTITNLDALPRGTGASYLLVIESPYANEYVAKAWKRVLPKNIACCEWIVQF